MADFTQQQYNVIRSLADGIFPEMPDSPAASQLPVPEMFISIAQTWSPAVFLATANALDIINAISLSVFNADIDKLNSQQLATITDIVANNNDIKPFWQPFRLLIALNYYALPPAYEAIGLPGPSIDSGGLTVDGLPVREKNYVTH